MVFCSTSFILFFIKTCHDVVNIPTTSYNQNNSLKQRFHAHGITRIFFFILLKFWDLSVTRIILAGICHFPVYFNRVLGFQIPNPRSVKTKLNANNIVTGCKSNKKYRGSTFHLPAANRFTMTVT